MARHWSARYGSMARAWHGMTNYNVYTRRYGELRRMHNIILIDSRTENVETEWTRRCLCIPGMHGGGTTWHARALSSHVMPDMRSEGKP